MSNNPKHRPFLRFFVGVLFIVLAVGSLIGMLGRIIYPELYAIPVFPSLLSFCIFAFYAKSFLEPVEDWTEEKSKRGSSRFKIIFLRIVVFLVVWIGMATLGHLWFPSETTTSTSGSMVMSLIGIVFGIALSYFCPIPQKWREEARGDDEKVIITNEEKNDEEPVIASESVQDNEHDSDNEPVIYSKEDITL